MAAEQDGPNGHLRVARGSQVRERKVLPHNIVAEASVLGGIILRNEVLGDLDSLETDMFYDHKHKVVFEAIRNLAHANKPIDVVTLESEIERAGKIDAIGGVGFLGDLCLRVPTSDNVVAYAKIIRDHHLVRRIVLSAAKIAERGVDWEYEADELLGEHLAELQQLERGYREASEKLPIITAEDSFDEIYRLARTPIFETPFPELNRALGFGGLLSGQVYYLAGGTGFGKTSFIATIVRAHAEGGRPALIAFWEMFAGYYTARMTAAVIGVPAATILRGNVDRQLLRDAMPKGIEMLDSPSMSILRRVAERQVRLGNGPPLIVVDYVQLLGERVLATMTRPDPRVAASMASAGLRELAKETGAAIIAVSAAGRTASKDLRQDVRKMPARDLIGASRESGSIEFDGAGVMVLSVSDDKDGDDNIATITVAKARFGSTCHIDARYGGQSGLWREIGRVIPVPKTAGAKPDDGSVRTTVTEVLRKFGPQRSKNQIAKLSGKNKTAVMSEIDAMITARLVAFAENEYRLNEPVPEPSQPDLPEVR